MKIREIALKIAWTWLGKPYTWGGDDPIAGFDCSGLIVEILKSVGYLARGKDYTAAGLWNKFQSDYQIWTPHAGALVFWSNPNNGRVCHVELCINSALSIGASGGGSRIRSLDDAVTYNAFIKVRPILSRSNIHGYIDPFKQVNQ